MANSNTELEKRLWKAADELRANSGLTGAQYSIPILGLIFLRYAHARFTAAEESIREGKPNGWQPEDIDFQARGVMYLPEDARWSSIMNFPESVDIGQAVNDAMRVIEEHNPELRGVLPKSYQQFQGSVLWALLRNFNGIPMDIEGDAFGRIYEYFLGNFAFKDGQKGGEFFTPTSIVRLMVEVIEPFEGRILDPACGSGGMFVQSARFVEEHKRDPGKEIAIYGQERIENTVNLCKMNLAVHGLEGDIKQANTYYEDVHESVGKFDFVMANPPFNVNNVDKERLKDDPRFPFGLPTVDNANYLWMQIFYSALNENGRAGFVMANSAADAGSSELEVRKKMINSGAIDVIIAIASNFFYTVTLPCTLWFLDRQKQSTEREDEVLFIDVRSGDYYEQLDRVHREFMPSQIEFISNIVRLFRGEELEFSKGSEGLTKAHFPSLQYQDIPGLCSAVAREEVVAQGWSLNPGRYVGVKEKDIDEGDFFNELRDAFQLFHNLTEEAHSLENEIQQGISSMLEESETQ